MKLLRLMTNPRLRVLTDAAWVASFAAVMIALLLRTGGQQPLESGQRLELVQGVQRHGIYFKGARVGTSVTRINREGRGWSMKSRFSIKGQLAAQSQISLYRDLSLAGVRLKADLSQLAGLGGMAALLFRWIGERGKVDVRGACEFETGICNLKGRVAGKKIKLPVLAGRGPVLTNSVYPLLAQGTLGRQAEIGLFDPLSMQRKVVTLRVEQRGPLTLRNGATVEALRISRDLEGGNTSVWIDLRGRVLREELPLGVVFEHESFSERP